jgi:hypothetical protein
MEFDNAAFERKIASTITSLGQLEKALKFDGAKSGLQEVGSAVDKFNLGNLSTVVEGVSAKFLALATIAVTALQRITNKAIDVGVQLVKSLSLDQVMAGFSEYELKLGSIQTIMAGTGAPLDVVNQKLQELNEYSDRTIYSFKDMTSNIGKFTNAGVSLDQSVASIQGVANVAALSGANAEEASRAMYNFAQALSKGYVQLVDWKSIELANMGTKEFKQQLIDAAEAAGTLTKKGEGWVTEAGSFVSATKGFNDSLTDQWLTTEVLNKTLGDYADTTTDIGKRATAAAQDVKTFSQLLSTIKESIGSGWAQSFEILIGNFDEAKALFTDINNVVSSFVGKNADARNALLQGWKDLGGRTKLIDALKTAFKNLGEILTPIKEAFQNIFPPMTAERLMSMTEAFSRFAEKLKPSQETINNIRHAFRGLFSILEIGWTIIKEGAKFIGELFGSVTGAGSGAFLGFVAKIGDFFTELNDALVAGGGIKAFFESLKDVVADPIPFLIDLKDKIIDFFTGANPEVLDKVTDAFGRFSDRFQTLKNLFDKVKEIWEPFKNGLMKVMEVLDNVWEAIKGWFGELIDKIAAVMKEGDYEKVTDALNVGLLAAIAGILAKFFKEGFKFDLGGGFFDKVSKTFEQLTGVLKAMQTDIKANALLKIAGAIAILTASVLILSLIDSDALTKALTAMAIGFAQLMATFAILTKISSGPSGAAQFVVIASGLIILASAIAILSGAVAILANLSWDELARGLTGVTILLGIMTAAVVILSKNASGMILIGVGMMAIAVAINVLAGAVAIFASMSWSDLIKGFAGVAAGLLIIAGAMHLMPISMVLTGPALLAIAIALNILGGALMVFSSMSWASMGKGMAGIAGGLLIIAGAMHLMPATLPLTAVGLLLVAVALNVIAGAMKIFGTMSWDEIGRGLVVMAGALIILAVAAHAMSGAIVGAVAIGIMSAALMGLAVVLKIFSSLSWGDLIKGLVGIAAVIAVLAVAALLIQPAIGAMLLLGVALTIIGAGLALFGVGAFMVAKAFDILAKAGPDAAKTLTASLEAIGGAIPALAKGFAQGILDIIVILGEASPIIVKVLVEILQHLLEGLTKLIPEVAKLISTLITELVNLIKTKYPEIVLAGVDLILALLQGIRDRIDDLVIVVSEIIRSFLDALTQEIPKIATSVANLITTMWLTVAETVGRVAGTLLFGVGMAFIQGFLDGVLGAESGPMKWFKDLASKVLGWIGSVITTLVSKGTDFITGLYTGVTTKITEVANWFAGLGSRIFGFIGSVIGSIKQKGIDVIQGLLNGITEKFEAIANWISTIGNRIKNNFPNPLTLLTDIGWKIIEGLWNGMKNMWNNVSGWFADRMNDIKNLADTIWVFGSPSKVTTQYGEWIMQGFQVGMEDEYVYFERWLQHLDPASSINPDMVDNMTSVMNGAITDMLTQLEAMPDMSPTITPVLDLTQVAAEAKNLSKYIPSSTYSYGQARTIAASANAQQIEAAQSPVASGVSFEQNIYAPRQLSTSDIYKNTRNQITLAKEELSIA